MRALLWIVALVFFASCGGTLPTPRISEVAPSQVRANVATPITIRIQAILPGKADYVSGALSAESEVTVFINDLEIARTRIDRDGVVNATLPANLEPKTYDLIVTLADGRQALMGGAITVNR